MSALGSLRYGIFGRRLSDISPPWLMIGDFNEIKCSEEIKLGSRANLSRCIEFGNWINDDFSANVSIISK